MRRKERFFFVDNQYRFGVWGYLNGYGHYVGGEEITNPITAYYVGVHLGLIRPVDGELEQIKRYFKTGEIPENATILKHCETIKMWMQNWRIAPIDEAREYMREYVLADPQYYELNQFAAKLMKEVISSSIDESIYTPVALRNYFNVELYEHQKRALYRWKNEGEKNFALFFEPRLGKTLVAIHMMLEKFFEDDYETALIVAPSRILNLVWVRQLENFVKDEYKDKVAAIVLGSGISVKERFATICNARNFAKIMKKKLIIITSYETFSRLNTEMKIQPEFDICILDEAHKIKDPATKQHKNVMKIKAKFKAILTGTPYANDYTDVYTIMRFITNAPFGAPDIKLFMYMYGYWDVRRRRFILKDATHFYQELGKHSEIVRQVDVGMTMPTLQKEIMGLTPEHAIFYNDVLQGAIKELKNTPATMGSVLALIQKLRQASSGFVYYSLSDDVNAPRENLEMDKPEEKVAKFLYTAELIEELVENGQKVIVCLVFDKEFEIFTRILNDMKNVKYSILNGKTRQDSDMIIKGFTEGNTNVLVVNPSVASLGLDLSVASTILYPSYSWSLIEERQMRDRAVNPNKTEPTKVIYMFHGGTIDMRILEALDAKRQSLEAIMAQGTQKLIQFLAVDENAVAVANQSQEVKQNA
jgi:SNF2 family DNA or RNA helicase